MFARHNKMERVDKGETREGFDVERGGGEEVGRRMFGGHGSERRVAQGNMAKWEKMSPTY